MITTEELVSFINHPQFKADLANECISIYFSNNKNLSIDEIGNVIEKNNNSSSEYEIVNPSAVIEFYKESIIEKINDYVDYGDTYSLNELKNKINLLDDIQDYCVRREENEAELEREINKSKLDLQEGFWTSSDGFKTKVHISTNYLSDEYVRLITSYENRDDEEKDYIDNLIATNPNESYITISINPTTEEIEFTLNGIYHANLINNLKYDYKFQLIKDLSKLLYNVDTIDNSTTNEYKQQIGSNFEKYKEIVDSVIVEGLTNSIYDIHKDDFFTRDEEHDCRYYCEFYGNHLDVYQDIDKNSDYRIGLVFDKKQECVDYFIDRIIDGNVDYDVHQRLTPYNKEIFRIAENKIKNLVLQKLHTQELYNISRNIDWSGFTEEMFNKFKNELLTGNEKPDWKGSINVGSVSFEITQYEKTEENPWIDYKVFVLGEDNGYEYDGKDNDTIPYAYYEGNQFVINMITENSYEEFKNKFTELIINDIKENNIQNSEHVKKEMMRPTINWSNYETSKKLYLDKIIEKIEWKYFYLEKLNGKEFFKTETLSNINELKFIINSLEPALDFKKSDAEIVLDYLVGGDYLSFENNTLKYKGDDGKAYGENLFDVLNYIEANIEEHIENITMNIEDELSNEEDQEYLKILKEQVLPSIQNKCNILRLKEIFKDKSSDMAFNCLDKANFDELYLDCKNSFPSKTDEELLVEAASRMIMSNVNDFGYFSVQNYDELFDKEDGADYRFTLCEAAAKELIDRKISDFSQVEEYIKNQSKEVFKNECLKELEKQTFLDDVEKIVDLSIDSLDKDDYLDTYSYLTEEEYDRTKYLFDNFYKTENQTGSIDLKALYDSKENIDNVVTLENGAEIRKVIESDEGEEREYYDLYDKDLCSICDGENYEVKAVIDGTYYLKGLDSEYEDSGFALSTDEYLIATKQQNQGKELVINEDTYIVLADKIYQAAYEASASGFNYSFNFDEIATLADRDIEWVKLHIEKIGEALATYHNDELLLDFNPKENINLEENQIEFNFCSVGEDANELFKFEDGRWERKSNRELEADGYIIPVDLKYSFTYKPTNYQQIAEEKQLLVDSICDLFIGDSELIDQKVKSLPNATFNIEFILRHDFAIEPGTDYFNLKFDNINNRMLHEMNNIIKNNEKLHCFTIDSIESFIPEEFHIRKNLVLIDDENIEYFSKTPEEFLKELNPEIVSFVGSSMSREEDDFISDKNDFLEIMEKYPAIKNYVEKKWDLLKEKILKEKSMQHEKEINILWNKGILLFKDTKYWEEILTETSAENFKVNESVILSKIHSKIRQEIVDNKPNENINWEKESWNYICETMQRKSLNNNYNVNYVNGLTSKDLQDFIACDFITIKMNLHDKEMEPLWEELEDIPFIEDEDGRLILDSDEPWHNFEPGTTKEEIWHYFDRNHSKGINYLVNEYESKTKELQEQSKKEGYEAGYLFDSDESIISWKDLKKIDSTFSNADFIEIIREIKESNENFSEKELKEELVFRIIEDEVDWHGFEHSLIDNEQIDSGKLLDTRCYILEQVSEVVVNKQINSFEKIQNKVDELLFNDSRTKDFFIMDCVKSEIDKDFDFWQEIDCNPRGSVNDTIGSYQFLAGISNEVAKKLGLSLRNEDENLNYQYEILGTYEMIPEKFTESGQPFIRFDNREIDFCCNISSDDETFMKQEIFSFDFHDSNYSYDILYKYFDKCVAKSMEQTQEYELFLNNPQEYVEKCVLSIVAPTVPSIELMQIVEEVSKEELNIEKNFKNLLLENLKTSKNPFEATYKIFEDLKEKNDTEKIKKFNQYLKDNDCNTKKDFERFFTEIIGLTKKEPKRSIRKLKIERELEK